MSPLNKLLVVAFGAALALLGLFVLASGGASIPTRSPPTQFRFSGASLFFLGASPLVLGSTLLAVAFQALRRESRATQWAIGAGIAMCGLAFVMAPKL